MRVRLIYPFKAKILRLDTQATAQAAGYDPVFNEVRTQTVNGARVVERVDKRPVYLRCQVEDQTFKSARWVDAGDSPEFKIGLVADMYHLRRDGHVDRESGLVHFQINDRLAELRDERGDLVHIVPQVEGGLYCVEVRPISYGIGRRLDLVLLRYNDRRLSEQ